MEMRPFLWITLPYPLLCPVSSLWSLGGAATRVKLTWVK